MIFNFHQEKINDWAKLSGDYNPIHFDSEYARSMGLNDIVVHGMLPLLHIKEKISQKNNMLDKPHWLTIKARFKEPIARNMTHEFVVKEKNNKCKFKLCATPDTVSSSETIVGTYFTEHHNNSEHDVVGEFNIDRDLYIEKKDIFQKKYPKFDKTWLLLDAITFSQFLSNEIPFNIVKQYSDISNLSNQDELMSTALTVQTSHTISVESSFFSKKICDTTAPRKIICKLIKPTIVSSDSDNLTCLCQFNVFIDGKFIMISEIGLLVRFNINKL